MITSIEYIEKGMMLYGITLIFLVLGFLYLFIKTMEKRKKKWIKNKKEKN